MEKKKGGPFLKQSICKLTLHGNLFLDKEQISKNRVKEKRETNFFESRNFEDYKLIER